MLGHCCCPVRQFGLKLERNWPTEILNTEILKSEEQGLRSGIVVLECGSFYLVRVIDVVLMSALKIPDHEW